MQRTLTWNRVTWASRLMLPFYIVFNLVLGLAWTFQGEERTNPSLQSMSAVWPVPATGGVILGIGLIMIIAFAVGSRGAFAMACGMGSLFYFLVFIAFIGPLDLALHGHWPYITSESQGSLSIFLWPSMPMAAHFASGLSLLAEERTDATGNRREVAPL